MNSFRVLGFAVNNHIVRLFGIISNIKQFAKFGRAMCKISQTSNTGRTKYRGHQPTSIG